MTPFFCIRKCTSPILRPCVKGSVDFRSLKAAKSVTYKHVYSHVILAGNRTNTDLVRAGHLCQSARWCPWGGRLLGTAEIRHVVNQLLDKPGRSIGKNPKWDRRCLHWAVKVCKIRQNLEFPDTHFR